MKRLLFLSLFSAAILSQPVCADELSDVIAFLSTHVIGKTTHVHDHGTLASGNGEYDVDGTVTYQSLSTTANGFAFDTLRILKQTNWDLENGMRVGSARVENRSLVTRWSFARRKSTGKLAGLFAIISSSSGIQPGAYGMWSRAEFSDGRLTIVSEPTGYDDYFDKGGKYFPGTSSDTRVFMLDNGKLKITTRSKTYRVNPETMERTFLRDENEWTETEQ